MEILFVCQGNVGRSQMAESIFHMLTEGRHGVRSAGTRVVKDDDHSREGETLKETENSVYILLVLSEIGIDASSRIRTQITPELVRKAEVVVMMAESETVPDYVKLRGDIEYWTVPDPYMQSLEFTRQIRDDILHRVTDLIAKKSL